MSVQTPRKKDSVKAAETPDPTPQTKAHVYSICPQIGDGGFLSLYLWLEGKALDQLGEEPVTTEYVRAQIDALPEEDKHPRWEGVWGNDKPKQTAYSNRGERTYMVRLVLTSASKRKPPKCVVHPRFGGHRTNAYTLP